MIRKAIFTVSRQRTPKRFISTDASQQIKDAQPPPSLHVSSSLGKTPKLNENDIFLQEHGGYKSVFTASDFRNRLSLVEACLQSKQVDRAQLLFDSLVFTYPSMAAKLIDIHVHNKFLEALVNASSDSSTDVYFRRAFQWFNRLRSSNSESNTGLNPQPTMSTYAILIKGALKSTFTKEFVRMVVDDMKQNSRMLDYPSGRVKQLLQNRIFTDAETDRLALMLNVDTIDTKSVAEMVADVKSLRNTSVPENAPDSLSSRFDTVKPSATTSLYFVKETLRAVHSNEPSLFELQRHIESETYRVSLEQLMEDSESRREKTGLGVIPPEMKVLAREWHTALTEAIRKEIKSSQTIADDVDHGPFLAAFADAPERLAIVTVSQFMKSLSSADASVGYSSALKLVSSIGEAVEYEHKVKILESKRARKQLEMDYSQVQSLTKSRKFFDLKLRRALLKQSPEGDTTREMLSSWELQTKAKVGSILASLLISSAKVPVQRDNMSKLLLDRFRKNLSSSLDDVAWQPAFSHTKVYRQGKLYGVVSAHQAVYGAMNSFVDTSGKGSLVMPKLLPMVIPPRPWISYESGGFLTIKSYVMRKLTPESEAYLVDGSLSGNLEVVLAGLDALGATKWRINEDVLPHIIRAWNHGLPIASLPAELPPKFIPDPKPDEYESDPIVRRAYNINLHDAKQAYYDAKSIRSTENYKIEIARAFTGKTLYFPHNIDFRGRAYPIPPHFNHLGNDLARALLQFDEAKPLGARGLRWAKIHLANVFGNDKATFDERAAFVDQSMQDIMDSADDPFGNDNAQGKWWLKADKPWMCLAACIDLTRAMRSVNPETYESAIQVHQDGSCNGLQHYAALGGDLDGARQVNLIGGEDRPQDVYSAVALQVEASVSKDFSECFSEEPLDTVPADLSTHRKRMAQLLTTERINRKLVKQTVMTSVYGVTYIGAREQVRNRLREQFSDVFSKTEMQQLSGYITPKIFEALDTMFRGARDIQNWLAAAAHEIARSVPREDLERYRELKVQLKTQRTINRKERKLSGDDEENERREVVHLNSRSSVVWTTPLGLVVSQPYRNDNTRTCTTALQNFTISNPFAGSAVDIPKQRAAFPPNFIHSLDASHMLMTALACQNSTTLPGEQMSFAAVHDSYWTHACDVDVMRDTLKKQFVELHSKPVLENLRNDMMERYNGRKVLNTYTVEEFKKKLHLEVTEENEGVTLVDEPEVAALDSASSEVLDTSDSDITAVNQNTDKKPDAKTATKKRQKFIKVWEDIKIPLLPKRGDFDVQNVLDSEYFFS